VDQTSIVEQYNVPLGCVACQLTFDEEVPDEELGLIVLAGHITSILSSLGHHVLSGSTSAVIHTEEVNARTDD
jgi:hypothetical protein